MSRNPTPLPYGFCWWLDAVTEGEWYGIILDEYRVVLPLPVKRSVLGVLQIHRAPFTQQSGPFGDVRAGDLTKLLSALPRRVLSFELPLSENVAISQVPEAYSSRSRTNLVLDLSPPLNELRAEYGKTLRKKLRRYDGGFLENTSAETVISIYRASSGQKAGLSANHYRQIGQLMKAAETNNSGKRYAFLDATGETLAAGFFPVCKGRVINLFGGSTPAGFQNDGMARLLDAVIEHHQGESGLFDFEGSDIKGVGDFFRSFGAVERPYLKITR